MIIRIMGEGQFDVSDDSVDGLNRLDERVVAAIDEGDEGGFKAALSDLLTAVTSSATRLPDDYLGPSDYVLPAQDSSLEEVRALLSDEGLIPG